MRRTSKQSQLITAFSLIALSAAAAHADSLVTTTGTTLVGSISRTANGYSVLTAQGPVEVRTGDVKRILHDNTAAASRTHTAVDPAEINSLLSMGKNAMAAGDFVDARDAFTDALSLDKGNATAARGLGFAYLKLEKPQKAADVLARAAPNPPVDRTMTLAMASSLISKNNPMRAVKFLIEYLKAHDASTDEPVVNALGITLNRQVIKGDTSSLKSPLFNDAVKLYSKLNDQLESAKPGKKRWGIAWDDAGTVNKKFKAYNEAMKKKADAWNGLQNANAKLTAANNELQNAAVSFSSNKPQQIANAENDVRNAQGAQSGAQNNYDKVCASIAGVPGPEYPDTISLEDVDLSMQSPEVLASAAPTHAAPIPKPQVTTPAPTPKPAPTPAPTPANPDQSPPPVQAQPSPPTPKPAPAPAQVTRYAVGFAVAPDMVVTAASTCEGSGDIEIQTTDGTFFKAVIVRAMHDQGLVLLQAKEAKLAALPLAATASPGSLTCLGFPDVALFNPVAKEMTATGIAQSDNWNVSIGMPPRLPGGPLMKSGAVVGVELGDRDSDLTQVPAATLKSLVSLVENTAHPNPVATDPRQAVVMVLAVR